MGNAIMIVFSSFLVEISSSSVETRSDSEICRIPLGKACLAFNSARF